MADALSIKSCGTGDFQQRSSLSRNKQASPPAYELVKVFDLSAAPAELRDSDQLAPLRSVNPGDEAGIMRFRVGRSEPSPQLSAWTGVAEQVTLVEYLLDRWLQGQGAAPGEDILLSWTGPG